MDDRLLEQNEDLGFELRRYGRMLYRQRWWVLGTAAVVLIASIGLTMLRLGRDGSALPVSTVAPTSPPPEVAAEPSPAPPPPSTRVLIEPPPGPASVADFGTSDMPTHAQAIASTVVAEDVRVRLDLSVPAPSLLEALSVIVEPDSRVLRLTLNSDEFGSRDPLPRAFAAAYLDRLQRQRRALLSRELRLLRDQSALIERQLATTTGDVSRASLVIRLVDVQGEIAATQLRRAALTPGRIVGPGFPDVEASPSPSPQPIEEATMPLVAPRPSLPRNSAAGLLLGLLLGAAVGLTREALDDRLRTRRLVEQKLNLPVLLHQRREPNRQAFERFHPILEKWLGSAKALVVTGLGDPLDVNRTATGMAEAAIGAGYGVALVPQDGDVEPPEPTSADYIVTIVPADVANDIEAIRSFVGDLVRSFNLVVIAAPYFESPRAAYLAASGLPVIIVIDGETTREGEARRALDELRRADAEPLGAVLYHADEY